MKLLIENWREYLTEEKERPGVLPNFRVVRIKKEYWKDSWSGPPAEDVLFYVSSYGGYYRFYYLNEVDITASDGIGDAKWTMKTQDFFDRKKIHRYFEPLSQQETDKVLSQFKKLAGGGLFQDFSNPKEGSIAAIKGYRPSETSFQKSHDVYVDPITLNVEVK